jgi:hypothetical protein
MFIKNYILNLLTIYIISLLLLACNQDNNNFGQNENHQTETGVPDPTAILSNIFDLIQKGDLEAIKELYKKDNNIFKNPNEKGETALIWAIYLDNATIANYIIDSFGSDKSFNTISNVPSSINKLSALDYAKQKNNTLITSCIKQVLGISDQINEEELKEDAKDESSETTDNYSKKRNENTSSASESNINQSDSKPNKKSKNKSKVKSNNSNRSSTKPKEKFNGSEKISHNINKNEKESVKESNEKVLPKLHIDLNSLKQIGKGAGGIVYEYNNNGKIHALKLGVKDLEIKNLYNLQSTNAVPKITNLYNINNNLGLEMELGQESVDDAIINKHKIDDNKLLEALNKMIELGHELKKQKIEYSDVKPSNLLIMQDGSIKAIDIDNGATHGYIGSYGNKMAKSLLEAKLNSFLSPARNSAEFLTRRYRDSSSFEKYQARVIYKKSLNDNNIDVSIINDILDVLDKLDLYNKTEEERSKIFIVNKFEKLDNIAIDDLKLYRGNKKLDEDGRDALSIISDSLLNFSYPTIDECKRKELYRSIFYEALGDAFKTEPSSELKKKLIELYELPE